jgi:8-amino-7-oxononanoate synthase
MAGTPDTGSHERALAALARRGRLRSLAPTRGLDFTSNDFLALASSPVLRDAAMAALASGVPTGAGGSRLLRGNHREHEALEAEAAAFFGSGAALYFNGGFSANSALIATLPARGDLVVHDALVHASAWEGMALTKASCVGVAHNDLDAFDDAVLAYRAGGGVGRVWIAIETLYSMDGDTAPVADFVALAARHGATLVLDEAHATGVLGPGGRGLGAPFEGLDHVISLHTCGKGLGASGALVTCSRVMRDFLINRARGFIYATAPSPLMAAVVRRALGVVREEIWRREQLADLVGAFGQRLERVTGIKPTGTHIQPIIVGADARAVEIAGALQANGFDVRAIRPPTVAEGTARLRIVLTLNTSEADGARKR